MDAHSNSRCYRVIPDGEAHMIRMFIRRVPAARRLSWLFVLVALASFESSHVSAADAAATEAGGRVSALADAYVRDYFEVFPYQALTLGAPDLHPNRLADHSLPALHRWQHREDALLTDLKKIDIASVAGTPQEITYEFLQNLLESSQGFRV